MSHIIGFTLFLTAYFFCRCHLGIFRIHHPVPNSWAAEYNKLRIKKQKLASRCPFPDFHVRLCKSKRVLWSNAILFVRFYNQIGRQIVLFFRVERGTQIKEKLNIFPYSSQHLREFFLLHKNVFTTNPKKKISKTNSDEQFFLLSEFVVNFVNVHKQPPPPAGNILHQINFILQHSTVILNSPCLTFLPFFWNPLKNLHHLFICPLSQRAFKSWVNQNASKFNKI